MELVGIEMPVLWCHQMATVLDQLEVGLFGVLGDRGMDRDRDREGGGRAGFRPRDCQRSML